MAKLGDKGTEVTEVQKLLSLLSYDLVIDGGFGAKTDKSLRAFQKKMGLTVDGVAGPKTIEALKNAQKKTAKEDSTPLAAKDYGTLDIDKSCMLEDSQYLKQVTAKDKLFVHFTAGGPNAINVIKFWDSDEVRVSTAFVIDGTNAKAYECFDPDYWSFHLGIKGTNGALDKTSIGIEICAWGPVTEKDGKFYSYTNKELPANEIYKLDKPFRGYKYFHSVSDAQFHTLELLMDWLITKYNIPVQASFDESWFEFQKDVVDKRTPGIWTHTTVRKDKSDMYPDKRLIDLLNKFAKKYNS
jgi:N-acetyl-anhydromuramyl-L-alanine amidase AmpD